MRLGPGDLDGRLCAEYKDDEGTMMDRRWILAGACALVGCGARSAMDLLDGVAGHTGSSTATTSTNQNGSGGATTTTTSTDLGGLGGSTTTSTSQGGTGGMGGIGGTTACTPDCAGKICGQDDGCDGKCTNCPVDQICDTASWQCQPAMIPTDGLVAYFHCDGNAEDVSGNGNNGTIYGATPTADRFGNPSSACYFDGNDDWIDVPDSPSLQTIEQNQGLTVAAWIRIDGWYQDWNVFAIVEKLDVTDDQGWEFMVGAQPSVTLGLSFRAYVANTVGWSVSFGEWRHVAVAYDGSAATVDLYADGQLLGHSTAAAELWSTGAGHLHIGKSFDGPDEFSRGAIDEVLIYNRALSSAEILALYGAD
jgi:hypothetical protein